MAVSVPLGTDNGVTKESDFAVLSGDGGAVRIYPFELYRNMFWSQPLTAGSFSRVAEGNPVRPVTLEKEDHEELRAKGEARKGELLAAQEEARREAARREAAALRERLSQLEARRDDLSRRIAAAEQAFLAEETKYSAAWNAFDAGTEQSLQNIMEYLVQRDELLERRYPASARRPSPSAETGRLDARIRQLESQIASERENLRAARDGRRAARSAFLA
jgi:chromosome segregation ATPase